jgi:hypothetical protein
LIREEERRELSHHIREENESYHFGAEHLYEYSCWGQLEQNFVQMQLYFINPPMELINPIRREISIVPTIYQIQ